MQLLPLLTDSMAYVSKLGKTDAMEFDRDFNATTGTYTDTTHLNMYALAPLFSLNFLFNHTVIGSVHYTLGVLWPMK